MMWDAEPFTGALRAAHADGRLPPERLSDMVRRILRSIYAVGVDTSGSGAGRRHGRTTARSRSTPHARASSC